MDDWPEAITRLLFESSFMTLSTADADGTPWANPVEFACDEDLRFYWTSLVEARHSRNVRANPRAGAVIYDSRQLAGVYATVEALYLEGTVEELSDDAFEPVRPSIRRWIDWARDRRAPEPVTEPVADAAAEGMWRQYRLTPVGMYALDPAGHPHFPGIRVSRIPVDLTVSFTRAYRAKLE